MLVDHEFSTVMRTRLAPVTAKPLVIHVRDAEFKGPGEDLYSYEAGESQGRSYEDARQTTALD